MTADSGSFRPDQIEALATGTSFLADPGERDCPACGERRLLAYVQSPPVARRPTRAAAALVAAMGERELRDVAIRRTAAG
jgi:hypothetical protein